MREAYVHRAEQITCTFAELVDFFKESQCELDKKESGMLFNCCRYREDSEPPVWVKAGLVKEDYIRRCKDNVESISCLLLDVDGTKTLAEVVEYWCDYEFLVYSTHGNSPEKEKFRLVIPLLAPLTREQFDERHTAMVTEFGVDSASFTISQAFYLPSYSRTNKNLAYVYWNQQTTRYDARRLAVESLSQRRLELTISDLPRTNIATSIIRTLQTGSDLHYADALTLAILCKANGIDSATYQAIVNQIAHPDSDLRGPDVDVAKLYKSAYATHITHRRAEALMRRLNCNMWRWEAQKL